MATAVTSRSRRTATTPPDAEEEFDGGEMTLRGHLRELRSRVTWMAGAIIVGMCIFLVPSINFAIWDFLLERAGSPAPDLILLASERSGLGAYYPVHMELLGVGATEAFVVLVISLIVVGVRPFPEIAPQGGRYVRMASRYAPGSRPRSAGAAASRTHRRRR